MKSMMSRFHFKPSGLKMLQETESKTHKIRIVAFSIVMGIIAGSYEVYYQNMMYRSGQMQA